MNTEEVVAMIDAIAEGRDFRFGVKTEAESMDDMSVKVTSERVTFFEPSGSFHGSINDPRTAREIAGALVAWANRKEGLATAVEQIEWLQSVKVPSIAKDNAPANCNYPHIWHASKTHRRMHYVNGECSLPKEGSPEAIASGFVEAPSCTPENECGSCSLCRTENL